MKRCIKCEFSEYTSEEMETEYDVCITPRRWYKNGEWETKYHNYTNTTGECHRNPKDPKHGWAYLSEHEIGCKEWEPKQRRKQNESIFNSR